MRNTVWIWIVCSLISVGTISMGGCASKTYTYNQAYLLSPNELAAKKAEAKKGDSHAARDVYLHYKFGLNNADPAQTQFWLKKAAALGDSTARNHLGSEGHSPEN